MTMSSTELKVLCKKGGVSQEKLLFLSSENVVVLILVNHLLDQSIRQNKVKFLRGQNNSKNRSSY